MNRCFLIGKVLNEPELDFLYQSKRSSIGYFWIRLNNNSIIRVMGYDENADDIYQNIKKGGIVNIEGMIRETKGKLEVEVIQIEKMKTTEK